MTATLDTAATREDFIATMIERKGDPATLKVYADWLEQRGECDLAYAYRWAASRGRWPDEYAPRRWYWDDVSVISGRSEIAPLVKAAIRAVGGTSYASIPHAFSTLADALAQLRKDVAIADDN